MLAFLPLALALTLAIAWRVTRYSQCLSGSLAFAVAFVLNQLDAGLLLAGGAGLAIAGLSAVFLSSCRSDTLTVRAESSGALPHPQIAFVEPARYATVLDAWPDDNLYTILHDGQESLARCVAGIIPEPGDRVRQAMPEAGKVQGFVKVEL